MRKFTISDIHGCKKTFEALLDKIAFSKNDELYLLGDYIDRGPDSKGVLDKIMQLQQDDYKVKCLRGNHEQMLLDELIAPATKGWIRHGGLQTLNSFGAIDFDDIPQKYFDFMKNLSYYFEVDDYILVHAGVNFKINDPLQDETSMLWLRHWIKDIDYQWLGNRKIIHGHTPNTSNNIKLHVDNLDKLQALDIDNGCCFSKTGLNKLCAFEMTNRELFFVSNIEGD